MDDLFAWVLTAAPSVPVLGAALKAILDLMPGRRNPRLKRALHLSELLKALPSDLEGSGKEELREVLDAELSALAQRHSHLARRKINGATVAAMIFVVTVGTGGTWGLVALSAQPWLAPLLVIPVQIAAVLVAGFAALLMLVGGIPQLWVTDEKDGARK